MRLALTVCSLASVLLAQAATPRPAAAILRDFDRVSMPSFSNGNDPESRRAFEAAIESGSLRKAELALELFSAYPDHARIPQVMDTRWATFNNVTHDYPRVIVETCLALENEDLCEDLAKVAIAARTRAITWSPQSTNRERLLAVRELIAVDGRSERTGIALMDVIGRHLDDPATMRRLLGIAVRYWPDSAWVGRPAGRWLELLDLVGRSFVAELPEDLTARFAEETGAPAPFTVVQIWSGWLMQAAAKAEIATLRELRDEPGGDVRILGFLIGDLQARLPDAIEAGVDWPQIGVDGPGPGRSLFGVVRTPCYFVLDGDHRIVGIVGSAKAAAQRIRTVRG